MAQDNDQQVFSLNDVREKKLEEKRRKTERIFFKNLLGVYSVVGGGNKIRPIELIDISETGCSFQIPYKEEDVWPNDVKDMPVRLYFSQDTFLEITLHIKNSRPSIQEGVRYTQFGCEIEQNSATYETFKQFVKFMKLYAEHSRKDNGDVSVYYI